MNLAVLIISNDVLFVTINVRLARNSNKNFAGTLKMFGVSLISLAKYIFSNFSSFAASF